MNATRNQGPGSDRLSPRTFAGAWLGAGLVLVAVAPAQTDWLRARVLTPRRSVMVYDAARERVVLFGGAAGSPALPLPLGDTWEWDGASWLPQDPATSPPARQEHAMAYDAARQRVVLFGGSGGSSAIGDTWEWDGVNWSERKPAVSPGTTYGHALAYDAARQRVVLFANETWEWDGVIWIRRNPVVSPPHRSHPALAYDAVRQRIVLFGGSGSSGVFGDTWEWDGINWVQQNPTTRPPARAAHSLAYDAARQRVILFGGEQGAPVGALGDTWEWDGTNWSQRSSGASPSPRSGAAMAYDAARQRLVLTGGAVRFHTVWLAFGDTWEWDGASWSLRTAAASPSGRNGQVMAYDVARQRVVLFGGFDYSRLLADTWEWDGAGWTQRNPTVSPPAHSTYRMAYDAARQRVVLFGQPAETWEWDGLNWTLRNPAARPGARWGHAMAYDASRQRVVLFGGWDGSPQRLADTWEWDGTSWTQRSPAASPPRRMNHAMAYDAARQRVVLFGGQDSPLMLFDTWEWDGAGWTQRSSTSTPPARHHHALVYDAARLRVVLFGGVNGSNVSLGDTWEWDGSSWAQRSPPTTPTPRGYHGMAYDAARQRVVMLGDAPGQRADTWLYGSLAPAAAQTIGSACAGTNGPPALASNPPFVGNQAFVLDLLSARTSAPCLVLLATGTQALSLGGGCTLYLQGAFVPLFAAANASGFATVKVSIPLDPSLRGGTAYAQGFVFDPMGAFAGVALSAGRRLVLGD